MEKISKYLDIPLLNFADTTVTVGQVIGVVAFVVLGALFLLWSARFLDGYLQKRVKSQDLSQMVRRAFLIVGFIVLGLITLDLLQIPLTAFAFISGAIAIGVGFGAQNIINNFISGWILMWERPIKIGDFRCAATSPARSSPPSACPSMAGAGSCTSTNSRSGMGRRT